VEVPGTTVDASALAGASDLAGPESIFRFSAAPAVITGSSQFTGTFVFSGSRCNQQIHSMCLDGSRRLCHCAQAGFTDLTDHRRDITFAVPEPSMMLAAVPVSVWAACCRSENECKRILSLSDERLPVR
jgi:hypothetical protein